MADCKGQSRSYPSPILINDHGICSKGFPSHYPTQIPTPVSSSTPPNFGSFVAGEGGDNSAISPSIEAGERNLTSSEDEKEGRGRRTRTDKRVIESGAEAISDKAMNNSK